MGPGARGWRLRGPGGGWGRGRGLLRGVQQCVGNAVRDAGSRPEVNEDKQSRIGSKQQDTAADGGEGSNNACAGQATFGSGAIASHCMLHIAPSAPPRPQFLMVCDLLCTGSEYTINSTKETGEGRLFRQGWITTGKACPCTSVESQGPVHALPLCRMHDLLPCDPSPASLSPRTRTAAARGRCCRTGGCC